MFPYVCRDSYSGSPTMVGLPIQTNRRNLQIAVTTPLLAGTIEYATMTDPLQSASASASASGLSPPPAPSFHGASALNYRAPAEAAALSLGRRVEFEAVAVPRGGLSLIHI